MNTLNINPAFKNLIPPLSKEEYEGLEQNILADGKVRDALVLWQGTIVDGHNRYEIAEKHGLPYEIIEKDFEDTDTVKLWIIDNQLGRRNVPPFARIELAQVREPLVRKKAKEKQKTSTGGSNPRLVQVTAQAEPVKTRDKIAKIAKVSHDTYDKAKKIMERASPEILQDLREGKRSIHKTERELRVGSKVCEYCGEEKPLSLFQNEGGKKCLDCKAKKVEAPETTAPISNKLSAAEIALGTASRRITDNPKEYMDDLQKTRESVKQMAEYSRSHKRTIEEFQQVFKTNAERHIDSLRNQIEFMEAEIWADPNNKQIACDLIDEMVQAITNFKEEFLLWKS